MHLSFFSFIIEMIDIKKIMILFILFILTGVVLTISFNTSAEGLGQIDEIFDYQDYLDASYDEYENEQYIG